MSEPIHTIHRDVAFRSGIAIRYCAQIHADKIRVFSPFIVRYTELPYSPFKLVMESTDNTITSQEVIDSVLAEMARDKATDDGRGEAAAWSAIAHQLGFSHLENSSY